MRSGAGLLPGGRHHFWRVSAGHLSTVRQGLQTVLGFNFGAKGEKVRSARDIPNQHLQQEVLKWMESGVRGLAQIRNIAAEIPETKFYEILDRLEVRSLDQIPNFGVLTKLVDEMNAAQPKSSVA